MPSHRRTDAGSWRKWSGECEAPAAILATSDGRGVRTVDGRAGVQGAAESFGIGWTPGGDAVVVFGEGYCGARLEPPGLYLVDPSTGRRRLLRPAASTEFGTVLWTRHSA